MTSCDVQILTPRSIRVIPAINVVRICQAYHQPFVITRHRESRLTHRPRVSTTPINECIANECIA